VPTFTDRPLTALLVVDVQNQVVAGAYDRDRVIATIGDLLDRARAQGVPIVWVQHSNPERLPRDSEGWQIVPELSIDPAEPVVHKLYGDSFEGTDLEQVLAGLAVGRLLVMGAQSDMCIRSTLHGALTRGYDATLVSDAHTAKDLSAHGAPTPDLVVAHTNLYWAEQSAPGREAGTLASTEALIGPDAP
jgi:nicotinamidase-related amidase